MKMNTIDSAITASNNALGVGTGVSFYGLITSSEFLGLAGLMIGLVGLAVNVYFKWCASVRARQIHALQVARLRRETPLDCCKPPSAADEDEA